MRIAVALGLLIGSLALVLALRQYRAGEPRPNGGAAVTTPGQGRATTSFAFRTAPHTLRETGQPEGQLSPAILAAIEAETDNDRRSEALEQVVASVPEADLAGVLNSLVKNNTRAAAELRQLLVRRWAERNAPAAAAWAAQLSQGPAYQTAVEQVAIVWANSDLDAAAGWVHALPDGDTKWAATCRLGYEAARSEPVTALELSRTLPQTPERDALLVHAVSQWASTDSAAASAWALSVPDPDLRQRLVAAVAVASAEQDGAAAAKLAATALEPGEEQARAAVAIVQRWTQTSPHAAASWAAQFPEGTLRDAGVAACTPISPTQTSEPAVSQVSKPADAGN